jgi:hypothetical protein
VSSALGFNQEALDAYNNYLSMKPQSLQLDFVRHQIMKLSNEDKTLGEDSARQKKKKSG